MIKMQAEFYELFAGHIEFWVIFAITIFIIGTIAFFFARPRAIDNVMRIRKAIVITFTLLLITIGITWIGTYIGKSDWLTAVFGITICILCGVLANLLVMFFRARARLRYGPAIMVATCPFRSRNHPCQ